MIQWKEKTLLSILYAPGKLSLQLQGWETLGYSSFALVLVSLSHTEAHVHVHTHLSLACLVFSPQHKFLCSLAFIQAHPLPGRQAVYFPCTFNSKYTYVFPMGANTLFPFPRVQGGIKTVHQHHCHHMHLFMWLFFFSLQHHATIGRGHPIPFLPSCWPRVGRAEGWKHFLSCSPC